MATGYPPTFSKGEDLHPLRQHDPRRGHDGKRVLPKQSGPQQRHTRPSQNAAFSTAGQNPQRDLSLQGGMTPQQHAQYMQQIPYQASPSPMPQQPQQQAQPQMYQQQAAPQYHQQQPPQYQQQRPPPQAAYPPQAGQPQAGQPCPSPPPFPCACPCGPGMPQQQAVPGPYGVDPRQCISHPTPPPEAFLQNRYRTLRYPLSGVTVQTSGGQAYNIETMAIPSASGSIGTCWRDWINVAAVLAVGIGGPALFYFRGLIGSDVQYLVVPSICAAVLMALGTYHTFLIGCSPESVLFRATIAVLLGYFGAHWLHYQGTQWYPEGYMTGVGAFLVLRTLLKYFNIIPIYW